MMECPGCKQPDCKPAFYHLCPSCVGEGCDDCAGNLVPGIVPGEVEEGGNIGVCSKWADPMVDAQMDDQVESLLAAVKRARESVIADREEADETL